MVEVEIVSSRIVDMLGLGGVREKHVITTFRTGTGITDIIDIPESDFTEDLLWEKIKEQVSHATKFVGQKREIT